MMDTLNKTVISDKSLQYFYKKDQNIPIGIRGMVDNTLGISKCGSQAIKLNSVINSLIQSQRLTLSSTGTGLVSLTFTVYSVVLSILIAAQAVTILCLLLSLLGLDIGVG